MNTGMAIAGKILMTTITTGSSKRVKPVSGSRVV
jgi:hypothetical protein